MMAFHGSAIEENLVSYTMNEDNLMEGPQITGYISSYLFIMGMEGKEMFLYIFRKDCIVSIECQRQSFPPIKL